LKDSPQFLTGRSARDCGSRRPAERLLVVR
jgi:hypothetical protein